MLGGAGTCPRLSDALVPAAARELVDEVLPRKLFPGNSPQLTDVERATAYLTITGLVDADARVAIAQATLDDAVAGASPAGGVEPWQIREALSNLTECERLAVRLPGPKAERALAAYLESGWVMAGERRRDGGSLDPRSSRRQWALRSGRACQLASGHASEW